MRREDVLEMIKEAGLIDAEIRNIYNWIDTDGKEYWIVRYACYLDHDTLKKLLEVAERRGIKITIHGDSWDIVEIVFEEK